MIAFSRLLWRSGIKNSGLIQNLSSTRSLQKLRSNVVNPVVCLSNSGGNNRIEEKSSRLNALIALMGVLGVSWYRLSEKKAYCEEIKTPSEPGKHIDSLPTYTEEELGRHNKNSERIWVSFKNGVYDITDFIPSHPGGNVILAGAGTSIEPFWKIYAVHHSAETFKLLESYRIGNLKQEKKKPATDDPFSLDPDRSSLLTVLTRKPFNAETPKELSVENLITPNEFHFKRNHLPVPHVDIEKFELEIIDEINNKTHKFKLDDIKTKYPVHTIPVTIQCSGNKRKSMNDYEPVQGLMWDVNAISTAEWTGVKLADILADCKIDFDDERIKHVQFEGLDADPVGARYGASVPKEKVFDKKGDVLIAFQMNGVDIPLDHGFPLRVVVPGVIGARSVKWLSKVVLSNEESKSHWQQNDYKVLPPSLKNLKEAEFSKFKAVQESPVQSAICQPLNGAIIEKNDEYLKIKGYAFSGGGKYIDNVIVSVDGGATWMSSTVNQFDRPLNQSWSWGIWECTIEIPKDKQNLNIICVATDSAHNTQPESCKTIWNARGVMNNAWHQINVKLI